jgi:uncharacterized Tic20 family protein
MSLVQYDKARKRVWILKARIHHGLVGLWLVIGGIIGAWLIWDDRHDFPWLQDQP